MRCFETRPIRLLAIFCAGALSVGAQDKDTSECNFDAYRPLRIGTPIRGGHEQLAVERVTPTYPPDAQRKGIAGRVVVQVLINRAGEVVKTCGVGQSLLAASAENAVSKWKFQKQFGLSFPGRPPVEPKYAVLSLAFDFEPNTGDQAQLYAQPSAEFRSCTQKVSSSPDERGIWLSSDDLMRRVIQKSYLSFPMLDGGCLHGEVRLNLLIDAEGKVACAQVVSGHPIAIASAMATIRDWRFKPLVRKDKGIPVFGHLTIPYDVSR